MSATFVKLGSVAEFINGVAFKPEDWGDSGTKIIRIQNLTDPSKSFNRTERTVSDKYCVRPGDLLVSWSATLGVFEWLGPDEALLNQHIFRVLPDENKVEKRYLRYALDGALLDMQRHLHGATMQHVNRGEFLNTKLFLPSLPDQKRIADILDRAEALRAKRRAALAQLDELVQSIFIDMFGDPVTNTKGWSRIKLEELIVIGPQNGLYKPASDYGSGVPILRIDAFYDGQVTKLSTLKRLRISDEELNLYKLSPGDIVINRVNSMEYLGKSAIIPYLDEPVVFESNMMRFSVDQNKIEPQYLVQFLQTNFIKGQIMNSAKHAVNQSSINQKDVKSFQVNVPPLPLQKEFIRRVEAINKLKSTHKASLAELDELFSSLQYRAFRGELSETPEINEQSSEGVKI